MKYYLDTAIWMDLHENRADKFRPLGDWAFELFRMIRKNKDTVLYSNLVIEELLNYYDKDEADKIIKMAIEERALEKVEITGNHTREASILCKTLKIPFGDCLHAILAKNSNALLVTRDKHFEQLRFLVEIKKPEELI